MTLTMTWTHILSIIGVMLAMQALSSVALYLILRKFLFREISIQIDAADRESRLAREIAGLNQKVSVVYDVMLILNELKLAVEQLTRQLRDFKKT